jgi:5-hydroxyisourate hydrolase
MSSRSPITTHVLDTARGRPAAGVPVTLSRLLDEGGGERWEQLAAAQTDADGRIGDLLAPGSLRPGTYKIRFDTGRYFAALGTEAWFYPWAEIVFRVDPDSADEHYHVPLLLNPFGYSTYRGS